MSALVATFEKICALVALMFLLGRTGFVTRLTRRPARWDSLLAFAVFGVMALTELWIAASAHTLLDACFISVCAAGLLAGPWVGLGVGAGALAVVGAVEQSAPPVYMVPDVLCGLGGGLLRQYRPALGLRPVTGFLVGAFFSLAGTGLAHVLGRGSSLSVPLEVLKALVNGGGVALLLLMVDQLRVMDAQARAAAMAEVRALQARMNPHFLFNALNTLAAMSATEPDAVPQATDHLARFMRAALEQHDRPVVPLREELDTVSAYLEIERLRFGERLQVGEQIDPAVLDDPVPPFLIQPLVENAVRHGARARLQERGQPGVVRLDVRPHGDRLAIAVADNGPGMSEEQRRAAMQAPPDGAHALALLRRRLHSLYDADAQLNIGRGSEGGTLVTVSIPRSWRPELVRPEEISR